MAAKKKLPSGLTIVRTNNKFSFSWKKGANYDSYIYQAFINRGVLGSQTAMAQKEIAETVTAKNLSVTFSDYYPTKKNKFLWNVAFEIYGKYQKPTVFGNATQASTPKTKMMTIKVPNKPNVTTTPNQGGVTNICRFSWSVANANNTAEIFTDVEWESCLVAAAVDGNGEKLAWKSGSNNYEHGTGSATGIKDFTENPGTISHDTHARCFRIRARGPAGPTAWVYATKRVYAAPKRPSITKVKYTNDKIGGYQVAINFTQSFGAGFPVDHCVIEYTVDQPATSTADQVTKITGPATDSWTEASIVRPTKADTKVSIQVPAAATIGEDQCLFVRVRPVHLDKDTPSKAAVVRSGKLASPSIENVTENSGTHLVSIEADNDSNIGDSFIAVYYKDSDNPDQPTCIAVIEPGYTTVTNVQCPNWSGKDWHKFGVQAVVGSYEATPRADGVGSYAITEIMKSSRIWQSGAVPTEPTSVTAELTDVPGTVHLTWQWSWNKATMAELSWADHEDAWMSTQEPQSYQVSRLNASEWNVGGLETGKKWWFRVRLVQETTGDPIYGPWSEAVDVDMSTAPAAPALFLSAAVISPKGSVEARWAYVSTDGTPQRSAEICLATQTVDGYTYSKPIETIQGESHVTLYAKQEGWSAGQTKLLCVRVTSQSGHTSEWSEPVGLVIATPLSISVSHNMTTQTITDDDETSDTRTVLSLTALPLEVTVTGAGSGGTTTVYIERQKDYVAERPDETNFNGFAGETIALIRQTGESQIDIDQEDLLGELNEGAAYTLVATVEDGFGQSASTSIDFEVHWSRAALVPVAAVEMIGTAVKLTPIKPVGWQAGETCDIYRLSADKPQLILKDAEFGVDYVDPFPAIGEHGGHRFVYKTADGNYITSDNDFAWIDTDEDDGDRLDLVCSLVDFDGGQIELWYDSTQSSDWKKDFRTTRYMGGSIQGDWNRGVEMTSNVEVAMVTVKDQESMRLLRRLADHAGVCHIRTVEGSSYPCDIQVSDDRRYDQETVRATYSLRITRVDGQSLDGVKYTDWVS